MSCRQGRRAAPKAFGGQRSALSLPPATCHVERSRLPRRSFMRRLGDISGIAVNQQRGK
jgi:hypothetical protein